MNQCEDMNGDECKLRTTIKAVKVRRLNVKCLGKQKNDRKTTY